MGANIICDELISKNECNLNIQSTCMVVFEKTKLLLYCHSTGMTGRYLTFFLAISFALVSKQVSLILIQMAKFVGLFFNLIDLGSKTLCCQIPVCEQTKLAR